GDRNIAPHEFHKALGHHQTYTCTFFTAALFTEAIEGLKQLGYLLTGQTFARIFNRNLRAAGETLCAGHCDSTIRPIVFNGIGQEINKHLLEASAVCNHHKGRWKDRKSTRLNSSHV